VSPDNPGYRRINVTSYDGYDQAGVIYPTGENVWRCQLCGVLIADAELLLPHSLTHAETIRGLTDG
jgi:hypothetical protein